MGGERRHLEKENIGNQALTAAASAGHMEGIKACGTFLPEEQGGIDSLVVELVIKLLRRNK